MKDVLKLKCILIVAVAAYLLIPTALDAHTNPGEELLEAARTGKVKTIETLLNNGMDINVADKLGNTPIILASKIGDTPTIDMLLSHKPDVNKQNNAGATPLMLAAKYGHEHVIIKLLDRGADPRISNNNGTTAAVIAKAYDHHSLNHLLREAERKAGKASQASL